jgi:hypothetical protein
MPMKATSVATMASRRGPRLGSVLAASANQRERGSKESSGGTVGGVNPPDEPADSLAKRSEFIIEKNLANAVTKREPACCLNASKDAHCT